jgi:hypothetical protein
MAEHEYRRLTRARPRSAFAVFTSGRTSLWLGKDHLLCIDSNGYTESYKRFYFRDIQAIMVRKTVRWKYYSLVLGVLAGLFALFALLGRSEVVALAVLGSIAGLFALALLLTLAGGATCVCHLRTAVHTEELPSLDRLRKARRTLERLRPLIAAAQGRIAHTEAPPRIQEGIVATQGVAGGPVPLGNEAASPAGGSTACETTAASVSGEPEAPPRTSS